MSMYSWIFGDGSQGYLLLSALGFDNLGELGRYRDAWLERGEDSEPRIAVYTRMGGGNREEYAEVLTELASHTNYLFDRDDTFDSTYCTIYFSMPDTLIKTLDQEFPDWREHLGDEINMSEVWLEAIDQLKVEDE